ncbi:carbohydrate ABC transporter permease [Paenibacillus albidus]|uniref:carbohydrate ABC transporter permease n=1 Tax=Paenibacillus albidus TaxID=2041023 RepID=UPI001BEB2803|nr:carbohydrate ABC transporter permease [Paenibacillus albidus]MBT2289765.1 carbohydrate ABC transporter permease [Paenibacillus albidus]
MMKLSPGDKVLQVFIYLLLLLLGFITLYPFWNSLVISFNTGSDTALGGITFWPRSPTFDNYMVVFRDDRISQAFLISILRTVVGTVLSVLFTAVLAYGLSRQELMGRKFYMVFCVITMYFSGGLIPTFLLLREFGMMDTFWVLVIPGLISVYNMIIFRTFFLGLPAGLAESARIDGCNHIGVLVRIILPISGPVVATLSLFTAVGHWNDWFSASIYINNPDLIPIQTLLKQILNSNIVTDQLLQAIGSSAAAQDRLALMQSVTSKSLIMATTMVATLPIIMVYPFLQKYFVKGVLIGSLKE